MDNSDLLSEMREWLKMPRDKAAQAQYAFIVFKRHFAQEHLPVKQAEEVPKSWWHFC